jgi:endonuclease/exonuclease/phosphatase (EEP) superfamily protein YafD
MSAGPFPCGDRGAGRQRQPAWCAHAKIITNDTVHRAAGAVRLASWNTLFWHEQDDPDRFYDFLGEQRADIYVLQEYMTGAGRTELRQADDMTRLRARFPGYSVEAQGELLTLSRFPIAASRTLTTRPLTPPTAWAEYWTTRVLRTDVSIDGKLVFIYNVHFADPFDIGGNPLTSRFYRDAKDLHTWRTTQLRALADDLRGNPNPAMVSGDLNALPDSRERRPLSGLDDAAEKSDSGYPATFGVAGQWLWRLDDTLTTHDVHTHSYQLRDPRGLSTHRLQNLTFTTG